MAEVSAPPSALPVNFCFDLWADGLVRVVALLPPFARRGFQDVAKVVNSNRLVDV